MTPRWLGTCAEFHAARIFILTLNFQNPNLKNESRHDKLTQGCQRTKFASVIYSRFIQGYSK
jgi:hypothetical protein